MSISVVSSSATFPPLLNPFNSRRQQFYQSLEELALFFERAMQLIPKKNITYCQIAKFQTRIKVLDRRFINFFRERRPLINCIDTLDLEVPLKDTWRTTPHSLESLDLALPKIPFFQHLHPYDNLVDHQKLYAYAAEKKPLASMRQIEDIAARFFNSLEFVTTPIFAIESFLQSNKEHKEHLLFRLPPKTTTFILQQTLADVHLVKGGFLGEGTSGIVSVMEDSSNSYAFKEFRNESIYMYGISHDLVQESAHHMSVPEHPSIIKLQAVNTEGLFFAYENGVCFDTFLKQDILSYNSICEYFLSIAQALAHIHSHGFIYKDLKASNIIIETSNPKAKLIDLGLLELATSASDDRFCPHITPPEVVLKNSLNCVSIKCDVWAFGVLLYQSITSGQLPFFNESIRDPGYSRLVANFCREFPCLKELLIYKLSPTRKKILENRDPNGYLLSLVTDCLHGNPDHRPSMMDIVELLKSLLPN